MLFPRGLDVAVVNLFSIPPEEKVADMVVITNFDPNLYLLMGTRNGEIKTSLDHFTARRSSRAHRYGRGKRR